ncbi:hypothetical protein LCGC14_2512170 [marine sediment metagenome]|uniref:Uncharacterized protein n=1 Tax=marine sediment metagenome TaxID=412755 RepID=A0A0F9AYV1_9ZZZZ
MSDKKYMWGCWVVWKDSTGSEWIWDSASTNREGNFYSPLVFTERRKKIMPLVRHTRMLPWVKSAKSVKVPIPEGP